MDNLENFAYDVASQTISQSWPYYILLLFVSFVTTSIGSFFTAYFIRRAQQKAISTDFESIKSQLRETTVLTESIRSELAHRFNRAHRIEELRREKLEIYLQKISESVEALSAEMYEKLFGVESKYDPTSFSTAGMLQSMYLPEFDVVHNEFTEAWVEFRRWLAEGMKVAAAKKMEGISNSGYSEEYMSLYSVKYQSVLSRVSAIERKARDVGRALIEVSFDESTD
jgi:hypothetical protein